MSGETEGQNPEALMANKLAGLRDERARLEAEIQRAQADLDSMGEPGPGPGIFDVRLNFVHEGSLPEDIFNRQIDQAKERIAEIDAKISSLEK